MDQRLYYWILAISGFVLFLAYYIDFKISLPACKLCIYQRVPYICALLISALAIITRYFNYNINMISSVLLLITFAAGSVLSILHLGVENQWWLYDPGCAPKLNEQLTFLEFRNKIVHGALSTPCNQPNIKLFGITLAGWNTIISLSLAAAITYIFCHMALPMRTKKGY